MRPIRCWLSAVESVVDVHGLLDEHACCGGCHGRLAVPVVVLCPLGGEGEVVREQLLRLGGGLVQHGGHCGGGVENRINRVARK